MHTTKTCCIKTSVRMISMLILMVMLFTALCSGVVSVSADSNAILGETYDPADIQAIIDSAQELLNGQSVTFRTDVEFFPDAPIKYYLDDSLLVICWKEVINNGTYTFAEVKFADGSQLGRGLAGNEYGSEAQMYPSEMAREANAIVAINGDFYSRRRLGITAYEGELCRFEPSSVESCFFTNDGKMLFVRKGEMNTEEEAKSYIAENDVNFAIAFGPIIVENGERIEIYSYAYGEVNDAYSRSAIAELGEKHYLLAVLGEQGRFARRARLNEFADEIYNKGAINAYTLDGGQTATIVFNGECFNRVDWGAERTMSDIIYFTAK